MEEQYRITMEVLEELGAGEKPMILVFNKIDLNTSTAESLGIEIDNPEALYISAKTGEGLEKIFEKVEDFLNKDKKIVSLIIPTDRYDLISMIHREGTVLKEDYQDTGSIIKARVPVKVYNKLKKYITNDN